MSRFVSPQNFQRTFIQLKLLPPDFQRTRVRQNVFEADLLLQDVELVLHGEMDGIYDQRESNSGTCRLSDQQEVFSDPQDMSLLNSPVLQFRDCDGEACRSAVSFASGVGEAFLLWVTSSLFPFYIEFFWGKLRSSVSYFSASRQRGSDRQEPRAQHGSW